MNIRDLQYLVALHEYQHFGKAANACFVSQPALSMQIKKLEELLGVTLIERTNKSLLFTAAGLAIAARAKQILSQVDEMHDFAKLAKDPWKGELKVGVIPTLAPYLLPLIMPCLTKEFPKLSFYLIEEQTALLLDKLSSGKIDTAILAAPIASGFSSSLLFQEEFLLAVPHTHDLSKNKIIKYNDLNNQNILLLEDGHCMREHTLAICHRMQAVEAQNFKATSLETLRHMVAAGNGITLIPKLAQRSYDNLAYIPFAKPKPMRSINLYWRKSSAKQELLVRMGNIIKDAFR